MPGPTGDCVCCEATCIVAINNVPAPTPSRPLFEKDRKYDPVLLQLSQSVEKRSADSSFEGQF